MMELSKNLCLLIFVCLDSSIREALLRLDLLLPHSVSEIESPQTRLRNLLIRELPVKEGDPISNCQASPLAKGFFGQEKFLVMGLEFSILSHSTTEITKSYK